MIGRVDVIEEMQGTISTNQYMDDASSQHTCGNERNRKLKLQHVRYDNEMRQIKCKES